MRNRTKAAVTLGVVVATAAGCNAMLGIDELPGPTSSDAGALDAADAVAPPDTRPPSDSVAPPDSVAPLDSAVVADTSNPSDGAETATVTSLTVDQLVANQQSTFTIRGTGLSSKVGGVAPNCTTGTAPTTGNATTRTFACSSWTLGDKTVTIVDTTSGATLFSRTFTFN